MPAKLIIKAYPMDLKTFRSLDREDRLALIQTDAVYLTETTNEDGTYILFQLDNFYLEVFYDGGDKLILNYFEDTELLQPYLQQMNINALVDILGPSSRPR